MKKLLALFLALMLAFSVSACSLFGGDKEDSKKTTKNDKEAVEETVNAFMGAFVDFNFAELKNYVVDEKSIPKDLANLDFDDYIDEAMEDFPPELSAYEDDYRGLFDAMIDKVKSEFTYEIEEVEQVGKEDKYEVTIDVTMPDFENIDIADTLEDTFSDDAFATILSDLLASGKITENSTEDEILDLVVDEVIDLCTDTINDLEFKTTTEELDLTVVKTDDGEWLIELEADDFSDLKFSNLKPSIGNF